MSHQADRRWCPMSEPLCGRHPIMVVMALRAAASAQLTLTVRRNALAQWLRRPISRSESTATGLPGLGKWAHATACHMTGGVQVASDLMPAVQSSRATWGANQAADSGGRPSTPPERYLGTAARRLRSEW
eukprot:11195446-Lingulodinium_polyedra.AAC.1